jgi:hypothetical protein
MYPYRVFVSYAREDREAAEKVVRRVRAMRMRPFWDARLIAGPLFSQQILDSIAFSHVFICVLTRASARSAWVHQEIGYAVGAGVPVVLVAVDALPSGIVEGLQAVVTTRDLADLGRGLTREVIEQAVSRAQEKSYAAFECAELPEQRTALLADYARKVLRLRKHGRVRQRAAFTSFCIPGKLPNHPAWREREGPIARTEHHRRLQREERRALESHARVDGCDLVLDPSIRLTDRGEKARRSRLQTLVEFLRSMPDDKARVVFQPIARRGNLLIVGDWFVAGSETPRPPMGYFQTICSRHAPTVLRHLDEFSEEFERLLCEFAPDGQSSRLKAVAHLERVIESIAV